MNARKVYANSRRARLIWVFCALSGANAAEAAPVARRPPQEGVPLVTLEEEPAEDPGDNPYAEQRARHIAEQAATVDFAHPYSPPSSHPEEPQAEIPARLDRNPELFFWALGSVTHRGFADQSKALASVRSYSAFPVPAAEVGGAVYPAKLGGHAGLRLAWLRSFGASSTTFDRRTIPTEWTRADASLEWRWFTAARTGAPTVSVFAGYAYSAFVFEDAPARRENPTGGYHLLQLGGAARVPIDRFALFGRASYDPILSVFDLGNARAKSGGFAFSVQLGARYALNRWLWASANVTYMRLTFVLDREPSGRVTDEYLTPSVGLEAAF